MPSQGDPHLTLGVAAGASLNEIKSAYRRLAKKYHPDAAGERALPRFLAIQAAYERLVDGEGRLRPAGTDQARAEPGRARASRDAWRARRSGSGGSARSRTTGGNGRPAGAGEAAGRAGAAGPAGTAGRGERSHARRSPRKATPGSTTYDEAAETPLDPEWDGGAWYGPSSGTYWTINPREYADPRKHGPEYLARARRAAREAASDGPVPAAAQDDEPRAAGDDE
jgi:curved DNA-binding protein CbpA